MARESRSGGHESSSAEQALTSGGSAVYRRIVEQAQVGIWTLDSDGVTDFVNDRLAVMLGYPPAEMTGRRFTDFVRSGSMDWAEARFDTRKRGVPEEGGVCDLLTRDGRTIQVRYDASPIRDDDGRIVGALAVVTQATEADAHLRHFAYLAQNTSDFVGMCDLEFRPFFVNKAGAQAVSMADRSDATVFDFFFEEDHDFLRREFFPKVLRDGNGSIDIRFKHFATGKPVWMHYNVVRIEDSEGRATGYATISQDLSERKRSEDLLMQIATEQEESLQRLRELADSMPQIVWSATADGVVDYRNRRWYEMTGTTQLGEVDSTLFVHPDDRAPAAQCWAACLASGAPLEAEFRLRFPGDDEYRWYVARGVPVRNAAGQVIKWYGTHTDIHEWKLAEAHLSESRERLRAALEASTTGTFRWNIQTNDLDWDDSLDRLFGLTPGESPRTLEGFIASVHPDDRGAVIEQCEVCAREGVDFEMEFRVVWPDGTVRWLIDRGRSYVDAGGRPTYMTGACVDVTQRKAVEERLAHKRRILERIARGAPLAEVLEAVVKLLESHWPDAIASIMLVDETGRLRVGAAPRLPPSYASSIEGLRIGPAAGSCGTAVYRREPVLVSDVDTDALWADYKHLIMPFGLRACWSVPIATSTGRIVGTIAVYYHEPRLPRSSETELALDTAASLAAIAIEKGLFEQALHEHARALTAANQNKDAFLARLAHELRNPLGAIQTALEVFRLMLDESSPMQRPRGVIDRQTKHMIRLIDELSDLSRIGTGKMELRQEPVDVLAIASEAAETIRPLAMGRQQRLELVLPSTPAGVVGDPARLTQVCLNLLNNAVKYTPEGGTIELAVTGTERMVSIRVSDNGIGIAPEMLPRVFDLYAQADPAGEHAQGGVGIGLHLVQSLVRLHGGSVTASSDGPGCGSTFEVSLPRDSGAAS